ncbi:MAG TPA: pirin family protein [Bryobacteraceae bacterium]|nr:pirin family protein [Bryobacteraceae bacterium]
MSIQFSPVIAAQNRGTGSAFSVKALDLAGAGDSASPVIVLDDFRVRGRPFPPHPHAGFAAVTYVFEDSPGGLRSRDSLGNDVVTGPGGIVWTQTGSGLIHEELPADSNLELHGLQIFVNLSSKNRLAAPQMLRLEAHQVPDWRSEHGDRVRVLVGSFRGVSSALVPLEPFHLLDVEMRREISFEIQNAYNAIVYVVHGSVRVLADGRRQALSGGNAVALSGSGGPVSLAALHPTHLFILSGPLIDEPLVVQGSFMMNTRAQIDAAINRFESGKMGRLSPFSNESSD